MAVQWGYAQSIAFSCISTRHFPVLYLVDSNVVPLIYACATSAGLYKMPVSHPDPE